MSRKIKKGDEVVVITGTEKGKSGKIIQFLKNDRIIVEGVNLRIIHEKKSENNPEGGIVKREGSLHASNVMLKEKYRNTKKAKAV